VREGLLSVSDAVDFCRLLLVAGNETITNLLGNGMPSLELSRAARPAGPRACADSNAVEEMLRYDSAVQALFRKTTQEVEVAGVRITAGASVLLLFGSANRDPHKFQEPARFDVTRNVAGQVAFGHGIHFCLGAPLARLEAKVVLEELLTSERWLSLVPGQPWRNLDHFILRGLTSLRVRVEPAAGVRERVMAWAEAEVARSGELVRQVVRRVRCAGPSDP